MAAIVLAFAAPRSAAADSRVLLDRLTWSADGGWLAVEAVYETRGIIERDTLVIDLSAGGVAPRNPRLSRIAFHEGTGRLAAATRYALLSGSSDRPEEATVLAAINPVSTMVDRLAFNAAGDTLLVLSRSDDGARYDITAWSVPRGRQKLLARVSRQSVADSLWLLRSPSGEAAMVAPVPLSDLYLRARGAVFYLERGDALSANAGAFVYDIRRGDLVAGGDRILARGVTPWAWVVSPDSAWLAFAGAVSRPDYGGSSAAALSMVSIDGNTFYTVVPEGVRTERPSDVSMMSWHRGAFWYLAGGSLYRLEPEVGRSRLVRLGADPGAWINSLGSRSRIFTLLLSESWPDSSLAVTLREKLRGRGWPAWVKGSRSGPFRVAVGASSDTDGLEPLAVELSRNGFEQFALDSLLTAGNSIPFPCGRVESPDGTREAYLTEAGPPGFGAGEVWISERHGLRQVRLVRAMLNPGRNFR